MVILGVVLVLLVLLIAAIPNWLLWVGVVLIVVGLIVNLVPIGTGEDRRRRRIY